MTSGPEQPVTQPVESAVSPADSAVPRFVGPQDLVAGWMQNINALPPDSDGYHEAQWYMEQQIVSAYGLGDEAGQLSTRDMLQVHGRLNLLNSWARGEVTDEERRDAEDFAYELYHVVIKDAQAEDKRWDDAAERARLHYLTTHDALTGLLNRRGLAEALPDMIARAERDEIRLALLFLDLDNFKEVNDTLGHEVGDSLLSGVANILENKTRNPERGRVGDVVARPRQKDEAEGEDADPMAANARFGGDEFLTAVAFTDVNTAHPMRGEEGMGEVGGSLERTEKIAMRHTVEINAFLARQSAKYTADGLPLPGLGVSIGYVLWESGMDAVALIARADAHMYEVKSRRRDAAIGAAVQRLGIVVDLPGVHDIQDDPPSQ